MHAKATRQSPGAEGSAGHERPDSLSGRALTAALSRPRLFAAAIVALVAAVAVYLPALHNGFIWDDPLILRQLRAIHTLRDLLVLPPSIPKFYFRPLIFLSYLADRSFGGETPFWFHASVIAWHAVNTLLVFLLARRLCPSDWRIASGGALLFAVFPTHVESVAWMAGRSDVIACAFVLATVLLYMDRARPWSPWLGGLTFLLGALSKETALACLAVVPLLDVMRTGRFQWNRYAPVALATAVYFALRANGAGALIGGMPAGHPAGTVSLDLTRALGFYVLRAAVPVGLCAYIPHVPAAPVYLLVGACSLPLSLGLILLAVRRSQWELGLLGAWFFITLAPALTVIVRRSATAVVADRHLYLPSVASCLLLAWGLVGLAHVLRVRRRWAAGTIVALSIVFGVQATRYTRVWANNRVFWGDVAAKMPGEAMPQRELGAALLDRGQLAEAEQALRNALALPSDPEGRAMTYSDLGTVYRREGRYDEAQAAFEDGLKIGAHPVLYHNLGMVLMAKSQLEQQQGDHAAVARDVVRARQVLTLALKIGTVPGASQVYLEQWDPAKTHVLLGQVLFSLGDRTGARRHLEAALRLEPNGPVADLTRRYMRKLLP